MSRPTSAVLSDTSVDFDLSPMQSRERGTRSLDLQRTRFSGSFVPPPPLAQRSVPTYRNGFSVSGEIELRMALERDADESVADEEDMTHKRTSFYGHVRSKSWVPGLTKIRKGLHGLFGRAR